MEQKRRIHINAVDIAVIILMVLAVVFAVYRYYPRSDGTEMRHISYYLRAGELSPSMQEKISVGDKVFNFDDGSQIGIVSGLSNVPPGGGAADGQSFYITVSADAQKGNDGYVVSSTNISVGNKLKLRLPNLYCDAECIFAAETGK